MTSYDLGECRKAAWFRLRGRFRIGLAVFVAVLMAGAVYGVYGMVNAGRFGSMQLVGTGLIFFIIGLFILVVLLMRPPAVKFEIDEAGVRLDFDRGAADVRSWTSARTRIRGRFTTGATDSVSHGQAIWSVYGPFGGFSESFVPGSAFEELRSTAKVHGFVMTERSGRPGWTLYTIAPASR